MRPALGAEIRAILGRQMGLQEIEHIIESHMRPARRVEHGRIVGPFIRFTRSQTAKQSRGVPSGLIKRAHSKYYSCLCILFTF